MYLIKDTSLRRKLPSIFLSQNVLCARRECDAVRRGADGRGFLYIRKCTKSRISMNTQMKIESISLRLRHSPTHIPGQGVFSRSASSCRIIVSLNLNIKIAFRRAHKSNLHMKVSQEISILESIKLI